MGEALISRAGGGEGEISNETKASLGLPNNATLDDVIQMLQLKDENYGTIVVTLLDADNSPIAGSYIQMKDTSGGILNYVTNNVGKCLFKTQAGQATFNDANFPGYIDMKPTNNVTVDCPVGGVYMATLKREIYGNGYSKQITSNQNIKFSKFINSINVNISGGGGGGSTPSISYTGNARSLRIESVDSGCFGYAGNGYINQAIINPVPDTIYSINIGRGGSSTSEHYHEVYAEYGFHDAVMGTKGKAGSTSKFGGILSANGGEGGKNKPYQTTPVDNSRPGTGTGATGGQGSVSISESRYSDRVNITEYGSSGQNGWCYINNFQYKI